MNDERTVWWKKRVKDLPTVGCITGEKDASVRIREKSLVQAGRRRKRNGAALVSVEHLPDRAKLSAIVCGSERACV